MARAVLRHILLGCAAGGILAGCVDSGGAGSDGGGGSVGLVAAPARSGAARDVEAPEIYQSTDTALWDGRPSLGGIWVAAPDVKDPERVIMVNPTTGKSVTGALFRRESGNPGPKLQLSSDAAEALGVLAGQPVQLRVTALRKVETPAPEAPAAVAAAPEAEPAAAEAPPADTATKAAPKGTAAVAAAALEASDENPTAGEATAEPAAAPEAPKRKTWAERRAEAKARREAEKAAKAAAAAEAAAADEVGAAGIGVAAVETAPLDARAPEATTAQPAQPAAQSAQPAPAAPAGRPIQVASFSQDANAQRAVDALAKIGVSAQAVRSERGGKAVWGVVAIGDGELLKKIKGAGFADAYFLQ